MESIKGTEIVRIANNHGALLNNELKFKDTNVLGALIFMDKTYDFNITFHNCTFEFVYFYKIECKNNIHFDNCKFSDDFSIRSLYVFNLTFRHCEFERSIEFEYCDAFFVKFIKSESKNGVILSSGQIHKMTIDPLNEKTHFTLIGKFLLIKTLAIKSVSGITVFSKECIINRISLSGYFNIASRLDFSDIVNNDLSLWDLNNDGKIYISNIKEGAVKELINKPISEYLDDFSKLENYNDKDEDVQHIKSLPDIRSIIELIATDYSLIDFTSFIEERYLEFRKFETILNSGFYVSNSSLGILEIKNVNFENKYILDISNSDLSSIKLINSKIPDLQVVANYLNYYNVYNDLYTSANKQNNAKDKIEYYKISQRYLYKFLKHEASSKDRDRGSLVAIFISELFSSHGTNWLKAIFITIAFAFAFFSLYMATLNGIYLNLTNHGFKLARNSIITYFPQFINPLHKLDFMDEFASLGNWSSLVDLFSRIVIGIGLFEIIRSFRKHVRQ